MSELIRFARVRPGSTVIDVYPGDGDWTRLFSDAVGPEGRIYSFVPAEIAQVKSDAVDQTRALAVEPGRENVCVASADLVAHRIDAASVREEVQAAGFVLDAESGMLSNTDDLHTAKVFNPSIKGRTDRLAYRFVKP